MKQFIALIVLMICVSCASLPENDVSELADKSKTDKAKIEEKKTLEKHPKTVTKKEKVFREKEDIEIVELLISIREQNILIQEMLMKFLDSIEHQTIPTRQIEKVIDKYKKQQKRQEEHENNDDGVVA